MSSKFHIAEVAGIGKAGRQFCIIEIYSTSDGLRTRICDQPEVWHYTRSDADRIVKQKEALCARRQQS